MLFLNALRSKFPIWADRQRNRQREKDIKNRPSLEDLIADIQDESRRLDDQDQKSDSTKALHAAQNNKGRKSKHCDTYNSRYHYTKDCLHNNIEKRRIWEQRTGKKWMTKDQHEAL
ncbi:hypothetical protein K3495_g9542 [Podosphaera aphanis]|nr:hypothetical protein K3495_g9542 [Podosphaera aphanis]